VLRVGEGAGLDASYDLHVSLGEHHLAVVVHVVHGPAGQWVVPLRERDEGESEEGRGKV